MGLLTSTSHENSEPLKFIRKLRKFSSVICILLYLGGICYFGALHWPSFHGKTYFSENALLPGLVDEEFSKSKRLYSHVTEAKRAINSTGEKYFMPVEWLQQKFIDIGLESYTQNFTVRLPVAGISNLSGRNVYGILRAPRGFSESVVLAIPYSMESHGLLGLLLSLAEHCREQIYWAKDLIFVIIEHQSIGMEAWLSAYHRRTIKAISTESLRSRGGSIQAAIAVELSKPFGRFTHADVKFNMVNGQLPNLDLINLVVRMAEKEALEPTLFRQEDTWNPFSYEGFLGLLLTSVRGLFSQAAGRPTGLHGTFGSYGIEALTLEAYQKGKRRADEYQIGLEEIARVLEGTLRSLNNLLERFHQSFFFYILPSVHRYISIGSYMPAVGLIAAAPLLKACCLWAEMADPTPQADPTDKKETHSLLALSPLILLAHLIGIFLYSLPVLLPHYHTDVFTNGIIGFALAILFFPFMLTRKYKETENATKPSPLLMRSILLILLGLMVGVTSLLNFGLGFLLAVVSVPVSLIVHPKQNRIHDWISRLLLILINPLVVTSAILLYSGYSARYSWLLLVLKTYQMMKRSIVGVISDCFIHGSWLFALISLCIVPLWTLFWTLVNLS